tara:strand:- start:1354 stop:2112 length:759 start_codon:yes stop_codon:yes gene_type:complete
MSEDKFSVEQQTKFSMIPEWLLEIGVSPRAYMVYGALAKFSNNQTKETFVSHSTLADKLNISRKTVQLAVKELEDQGCIFVERRYEDGHQKSNNYKLLWDKPQIVEKVKVEQSNDTIVQEPIKDTDSFDVDSTQSKSISFELDEEIVIKKKKSRINPWWKPMIEICGYNPIDNPVMLGAWNSAIKDLETMNADINQLFSKAEAYRKRFPGAEISPKALAKWWDALDTKAPGSVAYSVTKLEKKKQALKNQQS